MDTGQRSSPVGLEMDERPSESRALLLLTSVLCTRCPIHGPVSLYFHSYVENYPKAPILHVTKKLGGRPFFHAQVTEATQLVSTASFGCALSVKERGTHHQRWSLPQQHVDCERGLGTFLETQSQTGLGHTVAGNL